MSIAQYGALYSLIGVTYGGDGSTDFGIPDLRGRAAVGTGQGSGTANITLGQLGGAETTTLTAANLPSHSHAVQCLDAVGELQDPTGSFPGQDSHANVNVYSNAAASGSMLNTMISFIGGSAAFPRRSPFQAIGYVICVDGIYPSQ